MIFRNCFSASSMPAAVQHSAVSPDDQRFTLRWVRRTISIIDSHGLVDSFEASAACARVSLTTDSRQVSAECSPERSARARLVLGSPITSVALLLGCSAAEAPSARSACGARIISEQDVCAGEHWPPDNAAADRTQREEEVDVASTPEDLKRDGQT